MTYEDLKTANSKAYMEEKKTGRRQVIIVPADLINLMIMTLSQADKDSQGDDDICVVSFELVELLNALDDYNSEEIIPCLVH